MLKDSLLLMIITETVFLKNSSYAENNLVFYSKFANNILVFTAVNVFLCMLA